MAFDLPPQAARRHAARCHRGPGPGGRAHLRRQPRLSLRDPGQRSASRRRSWRRVSSPPPTPKDAIESLRRAYLAAGYPLIAVRAEVSGKLVAAEVINGRITDLDIAPDLVPYYRASRAASTCGGAR